MSSDMSNLSSIYHLEKQEILRKAYQLLAYFFANKQIAQLVHPDSVDAPLKRVEAMFFYKETSVLLLEVAVLFRAFDEQQKKQPDRLKREGYLAKVALTNGRYGFDMFDRLSIRNCCNKIIHANTFEPWEVEGADVHMKDFPAIYGDCEKEIVWRHFTGDVRITGEEKNGELWFYLINIPEFVEALSFLLGTE